MYPWLGTATAVFRCLILNFNPSLCRNCSFNYLIYFQENVAAKKPMLKLASFADLGQNGISDGTPMSSEGVNQCGQCSNKIDDLDNSLMWEAMLFCNVNCLGKKLDSNNDDESFLKLFCTPNSLIQMVKSALALKF